MACPVPSNRTSPYWLVPVLTTVSRVLGVACAGVGGCAVGWLGVTPAGEDTCPPGCGAVVVSPVPQPASRMADITSAATRSRTGTTLTTEPPLRGQRSRDVTGR